MKKLIIVLAILLISGTTQAQEHKLWTEENTQHPTVSALHEMLYSDDKTMKLFGRFYVVGVTHGVLFTNKCSMNRTISNEELFALIKAELVKNTLYKNEPLMPAFVPILPVVKSLYNCN